MNFLESVNLKLPMATKLGRMVTNFQKLIPMLLYPEFSRPRDKLNHHISTIKMPMTTKPGWV